MITAMMMLGDDLDRVSDDDGDHNSNEDRDNARVLFAIKYLSDWLHATAELTSSTVPP